MFTIEYLGGIATRVGKKKREEEIGVRSEGQKNHVGRLQNTQVLCRQIKETIVFTAITIQTYTMEQFISTI